MPTNQLNLVYKYLVGKNLVSSKEDFAEKIGYGRVYISEVLNDRKPITKKLAKTLLDKYSINMEWFLNEKGDMILDDEEVPYITNPNANAKSDAEILRAAARLMVKYANELEAKGNEGSKKQSSIKKRG